MHLRSMVLVVCCGADHYFHLFRNQLTVLAGCCQVMLVNELFAHHRLAVGPATEIRHRVQDVLVVDVLVHNLVEALVFLFDRIAVDVRVAVTDQMQKLQLVEAQQHTAVQRNGGGRTWLVLQNRHFSKEIGPTQRLNRK